MRQLAYAVFVIAGLLMIAAFALWGVAIVKGLGTLGWLGALVIVLAAVMSFIGAGLMSSADRRS